jgi:hypothetical protein
MRDVPNCQRVTSAGRSSVGNRPLCGLRPAYCAMAFDSQARSRYPERRHHLVRVERGVFGRLLLSLSRSIAQRVDPEMVGDRDRLERAGSAEGIEPMVT